MDIEIRHSTMDDLPVIMQIIDFGKEALRAQGVDQWEGDYPNEHTMMQDIERGISYVATTDGKVVGTVCLDPEPEPAYDNEELHWKTPREGTLVVHRLAISKDSQGLGIASKLLKYAAEISPNGNKRGDTSEENKRMRAVFEKAGYQQVGLVEYTEDGGRICMGYEYLA